MNKPGLFPLCEVILGDIWLMTPAVLVRLLAGWIEVTIDRFCPCGEEDTVQKITHIGGGNGFNPSSMCMQLISEGLRRA